MHRLDDMGIIGPEIGAGPDPRVPWTLGRWYQFGGEGWCLVVRGRPVGRPRHIARLGV